MKEYLDIPDARTFMKSENMTTLRKPVFIITAIMIVQGVTVRNEKKTDHQFKAEANGDIKMAKIGMEGGGKWKSGG